MGFIRSGAVVLLTSILFLSLLLGNIFLTLNWSLEYQTIQPEVKIVAPALTESLGLKKTIDQGVPLMQLYCQAYPSFQFNEAGINLEIPCDVINAGTDSIIDFSVKTIFYQIYYKDYGCSMFNCLKETEDPLTAGVLISEQAKDFWKQKFNLALIVSIIILVALLLLMRDKSNVPINAGIFVILASFLTKQFNWVVKILPESSLSGFLGLFFTKAHNVFITMLTIGIILIIIGVILKFLKYGWKISSLFQKKEKLKTDVEEIVEDKLAEKKEIKKVKKKK